MWSCLCILLMQAALTLGVPAAATGVCTSGLCTRGRLDSVSKFCCVGDCQRCGGPGCGSKDFGPGPGFCCPAKWLGSRSQDHSASPGSISSHKATCTTPGQTSCRMPSTVASCLMKQQGKKQEAVHRSMTRPDQPCICRGSFSKPYRGACLPTFMVIGSQKAATSKLRW